MCSASRTGCIWRAAPEHTPHNSNNNVLDLGDDVRIILRFLCQVLLLIVRMTLLMAGNNENSPSKLQPVHHMVCKSLIILWIHSVLDLDHTLSTPPKSLIAIKLHNTHTLTTHKMSKRDRIGSVRFTLFAKLSAGYCQIVVSRSVHQRGHNAHG